MVFQRVVGDVNGDADGDADGDAEGDIEVGVEGGNRTKWYAHRCSAGRSEGEPGLINSANGYHSSRQTHRRGVSGLVR